MIRPKLQITTVSSLYDVIQSGSSLSPHPLFTLCWRGLWNVHIFSAFELHRNDNQEFIIHLRTESSDSMFSKVSLDRPSFFTVPYVCPAIKQSKRVYLITLGKYRFLQHSHGWRVNFPRKTVNVIEVSAAGSLDYRDCGSSRWCHSQ